MTQAKAYLRYLLGFRMIYPQSIRRKLILEANKAKYSFLTIFDATKRFIFRENDNNF